MESKLWKYLADLYIKRLLISPVVRITIGDPSCLALDYTFLEYVLTMLAYDEHLFLQHFIHYICQVKICC